MNEKQFQTKDETKDTGDVNAVEAIDAGSSDDHEDVSASEGVNNSEGISNSESSAERKLTDEEIDHLVDIADRKVKDKAEVVKIKRKMGVDPYECMTEIRDVNPEDWSTVLFDRLKDPSMKLKFIASKADVLRSDKPYDDSVEDRPGDDDGSGLPKFNFIKEHDTKKYHYDAIRNYDDTIKEASGYTTYVKALDVMQSPGALGTVKENGIVFIDAESGGKPLNSRQKSIIESHEKGHVVRTFNVNSSDISKGFDFDKIPADAKRPSYLRNPDELVERMSQLKNYYNFRTDQSFSREHLRYAREHYLTDTGLDNNMTEFFGMITSEKEDEFLRIINQYPI
jgi:hypothetical protein